MLLPRSFRKAHLGKPRAYSIAEPDLMGGLAEWPPKGNQHSLPKPHAGSEGLANRVRQLVASSCRLAYDNKMRPRANFKAERRSEAGFLTSPPLIDTFSPTFILFTQLRLSIAIKSFIVRGFVAGTALHDAKMAEVVGLVTSVAGLAPLITNLVNGTRRLRRIRRDSATIPEGLDSLIKELDFLQLVMQNVNALPYASGADYCQEILTAIAEGIEELLDKYPLRSVSSGKKPNLKEVWGLRHWEEDVNSLRESVEKASQKLGLCLQLNLMLNMIQTKNLGTSSGSEASSSFSSVTESEALSSSSLVKYTPSRRVVRQDCATKACFCSCHRSSRISRRFWALDYTSLLPPSNKCDQPSCTASAYGFRLRVALSQLGIPWSVTMGLRFLAGIGSFSIQPALQVERVVKYTSPGFEIIWKLTHKLITVDDACIAFRLLAREDPTLDFHVDPSGSSFLISCAKWSMVNGNAALLEATIESGFDPATIDLPRSDEFPHIWLPWAWEWAWDIFRLQFLTLLFKNNPGFAGMTPLHDAILFGKSEDVQHWSTRSKKNERNFWGQTPLHLAVTRPQHLQVIVDAEHDLDSFDQKEATPLMYAAAYDEIDAARILIRAGADPFVRKHTGGIGFASLLIERAHWDFMMDIFRFLDDEAMQTTAEMLAEELVFLHFVCSFGLDMGNYLPQLLSRCKSLDSPLELPLAATYWQVVKGRTLLHYARSAKEVDALLGLGFTMINQVDQEGQHALMSVITRASLPSLAPLVQRLLDAGADINLQDRRGQTACHVLMQRLSNIWDQIFYGGIDCLHTLVTRGADSLISDNCRCSCSVLGCLPIAPERENEVSRSEAETRVILLTECIILILEICGTETAKQTLLAIIRQIEHKKLGMTHTCCRRTPCYDEDSDLMPEDDIDDILEEESEFIRLLDEKMEHESKRDINSLLRSAILDMTPPMYETFQPCPLSKTFGPRDIQDLKRYRVDHKNDCFVREDDPRYVSKYTPDSIGRYALWLEKRLRKSNISEQTAINPWGDAYFRRISWLQFLCNAMEISTEKLADHFQDGATMSHYWSYEKEQIREDVQHSFQSWEEWSTKGPAMVVDSTDGVADWPLGEEGD
ncbi:uncharacterized protein NECHADRAFT_77057 [Fusarium vanettenii 77-13-4]|uniref:Uncharacterized protein n=1 Tax=Fusarium vanettenii (strain ATCC MYA-4622 / CBS 123669 / FGSC 9596 / NRRL 45880 / 77-13-4) TaxID=660122 RepID=C7ZCH8_FUSV7|nr:uncharacterized protein NECHADRAFT_77057 [Fusarium vanettenii 77-13-4]EEU38264.1 hypothetical protein NECHADRAFT_77057 [Fusarium vanettenii 77-13-4]